MSNEHRIKYLRARNALKSTWHPHFTLCNLPRTNPHSIHSVNFKLWVPWEVSWLLIFSLSDGWARKMNVRQWTKSRLSEATNSGQSEHVRTNMYGWPASFYSLGNRAISSRVLAASFQQLDLTECSTCWSSDGTCSCAAFSMCRQLPPLNLQAKLLNVELCCKRELEREEMAHTPRLISSGAAAKCFQIKMDTLTAKLSQ